jgi:hypothetical protein
MRKGQKELHFEERKGAKSFFGIVYFYFGFVNLSEVIYWHRESKRDGNLR